MKGLLNLTRYEYALLGILALLASMTALVPWKELVLKYQQYEAGKYDYSGSYAARARRKAAQQHTWQVDARYSAESGALEINMSHRDGKSTNDLWLVASFSSPASGKPPVHAVMRRDDSDRFRATGLRLDTGQWLMSLTGIEHERFVFRREQVLQVD